MAGSVPKFEFRVPPVISFGADSYQQVVEHASRLSPGGRVLLITDRGVCESTYVDRMRQILAGAGLSVGFFADIPGEPTTRDVEAGLAEQKRYQADTLIAVGGGAVIDTAKAIAAMASNPGRISDYMGANKLKQPRLPLICLPSTAGTGSEVTRVTIITDPDTNVKMLISDWRLIPDVAIVDPLLTTSCPPKVTAFSGMDALTHAIEAYVSAKANPLTDSLALSAIKRISTNILAAYRPDPEVDVRSEMLLGSLEAGIAFSNASVALVHGMARPVGAYFHVPHGLSNAVLLPAVMEWSLSGSPARYAQIARAMGANVDGKSENDAAKASVETVRNLASSLGVPSLSGAGVNPDRLRQVAPQMAKDAIASGSPGNNPRVPTEEEIVALYEESL